MKLVEERILVYVDSHQKDKITFEGHELSVSLRYNNNHREKNPVLCMVAEKNPFFEKDSLLIVHHNHFSENSPFQVDVDLFSIPYNETIFAQVVNGEAFGVCGNLMGQKVPVSSPFFVPQDYQKNYIDRAILLQGGYGYKKDQLVFTYPYSTYEIVYTFQGKQYRVLKIYKGEIVAILNSG